MIFYLETFTVVFYTERATHPYGKLNIIDFKNPVRSLFLEQVTNIDLEQVTNIDTDRYNT